MKIERPTKLPYRGVAPCEHFISYTEFCDICGVPEAGHGDHYAAGDAYTADVSSFSKKIPIGIHCTSGNALEQAELIAALLNRNDWENRERS